MEQKEVMEVFEQTQGVLKGHFLLTSGRHSDTYMQCAKLFIYPKASEKLCAALADKIKKTVSDPIDFVVSPAIGGIIMGYEMARQLNVKNIFAERENGEMTLRRGFSIEKGANAVVVEDVVTTGGSVKEVIALLQNMGVQVKAVASIVDRSNGKVDFSLPFVNLISMDIVSYDPENCPICAKQQIPLVKPGSRTVTK